MTDEIKLLRAFIEASGYEVEEVDINPRRHDRYPSSPIIDYKVTKKIHPLESLGACVPMSIQSEAWTRIVNYITDHSEDIKHSIDDYGDLLPAWEFMNRNCK